jgi:MFS family permease
LVTAPAQLLVLRFVTGMGIGGVWPNAVSLVAEAWPSASRPFLAGLLGTAANVGFVLLGAIGYVWPITSSSWRWVPVVGTAPILLAALVLLAVSESPQWLAGRGHTTAASSAPARGPLREIFAPPLLGRTIIGILLGAIPVIGTSANGNWLVFWSDHHADKAPQPEPAAFADKSKAAADPRQKAVTQMQRSGGGILGSLLGGSLAALVGRRLTYFLISLFSLALSSWIFGMMHPHDRLFGLFTFLLGFVGITYFGWLPLFLPELFPTAVRSTGTGVCFNTGRVIAAVVVLGASGLVAAFHGDFARVGLWTGSIYALGMIIIWFAPVSRADRPAPP